MELLYTNPCRPLAPTDHCCKQPKATNFRANRSPRTALGAQRRNRACCRTARRARRRAFRFSPCPHSGQDAQNSPKMREKHPPEFAQLSLAFRGFCGVPLHAATRLLETRRSTSAPLSRICLATYGELPHICGDFRSPPLGNLGQGLATYGRMRSANVWPSASPRRASSATPPAATADPRPRLADTCRDRPCRRRPSRRRPACRRPRRARTRCRGRRSGGCRWCR